jgi:phosphate:Na+ symporter
LHQFYQWINKNHCFDLCIRNIETQVVLTCKNTHYQGAGTLPEWPVTQVVLVDMDLSIFLLNLVGAILLLLYSTRMVRTGVERALGNNLRNVFMATRHSIVRNALAGMISAAMLQSSTAVVLLVSGFTATGVMGVTGSLATVLGADLGTAIAVNFLSLDIGWLIPLLLAAGGILFLKVQARVVKQAGRILLGIAFMLIALRMIGEATAPLRDSHGLMAVVEYLATDMIAAFIGGAAITFLFHSSVAAILMFSAFAAQGVLPMEAGLPLVLGANLGGGLIGLWLTRMLHVKARRVALGNLIIRVLGAVAALVIVGKFALPLDMLGASRVRQLVGFHFMFNAVLVLLWLPLIVPLASATKKLLPDETDAAEEQLHPVSALDRKVLKVPGLALASATREVLRMGEQVELMLVPAMDHFITKSTIPAMRIFGIENAINKAQTGIKLYLAEMNQGELTSEQSSRSMELTSVAIGLERIGDIITKDLLRLAEVMQARKLTFSNDGWSELMAMHARVLANMQLAMNVLVSGDVSSAAEFVKEKAVLRSLEQQSHDKHLARLSAASVDSIATSDIHLDILRALKEINSILVSFAYPLLTRNGMLRESRLATDD